MYYIEKLLAVMLGVVIGWGFVCLGSLLWKVFG